MKVRTTRSLVMLLGLALPGLGGAAGPENEIPRTPTPKVTKVLAGSSVQKPGDTVSLNPQPLPPKEKTLVKGINAGDAVSLNPQPLPPKQKVLSKTINAGDAVSINPQPLPPKVKAKATTKDQKDEKDQKVLAAAAQNEKPQ